MSNSIEPIYISPLHAILNPGLFRISGTNRPIWQNVSFWTHHLFVWVLSHGRITIAIIGSKNMHIPLVFVSVGCIGFTMGMCGLTGLCTALGTLGWGRALGCDGTRTSCDLDAPGSRGFGWKFVRAAFDEEWRTGRFDFASVLGEGCLCGLTVLDEFIDEERGGFSRKVDVLHMYRCRKYIRFVYKLLIITRSGSG